MGRPSNQTKPRQIIDPCWMLGRQPSAWRQRSYFLSDAQAESMHSFIILCRFVTGLPRDSCIVDMTAEPDEWCSCQDHPNWRMAVAHHGRERVVPPSKTLLVRSTPLTVDSWTFQISQGGVAANA